MRRRSLRTRLTLHYAVPFFLSGVALLAIPIFQTRVSEPAGNPGRPGPEGPVDRDLSPLLTASAIALAGMVVVSVLLGWLIAGRFLRPLRTIIDTAQSISASNLHRRLGPTGNNDEFTELAETLDGLFERLETSFESQRHFVANASHELRTPLTAERALLQVALADPNATVESLHTTCLEVLALGEGQERLIGSLLTLATSEQGIASPEPFDLAEIVQSVVTARRERARGIEVITSLAPTPVSGDPSLAESLVANLIDNALRHNVPGGRIEITTEDSVLTVTNTGNVVPPDEVERLFQPFQRLRVRHGDGHGLGLAIVRAIATAHGAQLSPQARPEGGLRLAVRFPPATQSADRVRY